VVCGFQYFALRFGCLKNRDFGFVFCSVFSSQRQRLLCTMNGFLCFNALQQWLSACVTLLMVIHSLNCNCVWQCFINIYCLSNQPKNTFFRASDLFKCYDFNSRVWAFQFVKFSDDARNHRIYIISHKLTFHTDINIQYETRRERKTTRILEVRRWAPSCLLINVSIDVWVHWSFVRYSWWLTDCLPWVMTYDLINEWKLGT